MSSLTIVNSLLPYALNPLTRPATDTHRQLTIDSGIPEQILRHLDDTPSKLNLTILASLLNLTTDYAPAQSHLTHIIPRLARILDSAYSNPTSEFSPSILDFAFDTLANLLHVAPLPDTAHEPLLRILDRFLDTHLRPEFVQQLSVILQEAMLKSPELKRSFIELPELLEKSLDFLERYEAEDSEDEGDVAILKSNLIKIIVDLPNEDSLLPLLIAKAPTTEEDGSEADNVVILRMVNWISFSAKKGRADLIICAAHYLAALARTGEHFLSLRRLRQFLTSKFCDGECRLILVLIRRCKLDLAGRWIPSLVACLRTTQGSNCAILPSRSIYSLDYCLRRRRILNESDDRFERRRADAEQAK